MSNKLEADKIQKKAQELFAGGQFGSSAARGSGLVEQPIPIFDASRSLHAWFVPVTVGSLLAGFFEFQPDGVLVRFSSFQRSDESLEGCPTADSWIDAGAIQRRLNSDFPNEEVRELFLSYDRTLSRLAWRAMLESPGGTVRNLYVAGTAVWESAPPAAGEDSFGD